MKRKRCLLKFLPTSTSFKSVFIKKKKRKEYVKVTCIQHSYVLHIVMVEINIQLSYKKGTAFKVIDIKVVFQEAQTSFNFPTNF